MKASILADNTCHWPVALISIVLCIEEQRGRISTSAHMCMTIRMSRADTAKAVAKSAKPDSCSNETGT